MVDFVLGLLKCNIDYGLCLWVLSWFAERKNSNNFITYGSLLLSSILLFATNTLENPWINTIVAMVILLLLALFLFDVNLCQAALSTMLLVALCVICEFIPLAILSFFVKNSLSQTIEMTIGNAAFNLMGSGIFYIILRLGRVALNYVYGKATTSYLLNGNGWASSFPIMSIVFAYYIVYMESNTSTEHTKMVGSLLYTFILVGNICFFFGEIATEKKKMTQDEYKKFLFEQEKANAIMNLQEQHLKEMKGLVHDFESQLNGLQMLAREGEHGPLEKSIEQVRENVRQGNKFYFVKSKALQLILNQTSDLCVKYGIEFIVDIQYGDVDFMTFPDIFSLFENSLNNAINACVSMDQSKRRVIRLQMKRQQQQLAVQIENTYNKNLSYGAQLYARQHSHEHGYGIRNIKRIVKKYDGIYYCNKEDTYKIMILLPLKEDTCS